MALAKLLSLAIVLLLANGNIAVAQSCRDKAQRFARDYGLQWPGAPATVESRGVPAMDEATAPNAGGDMQERDRAIEQIPGQSDDVTSAPPASGRKGESLTAAQRTEMESLLLQAVEAADQGNSQRCWDRLGKAGAIPPNS